MFEIQRPFSGIINLARLRCPHFQTHFTYIFKTLLFKVIFRQSSQSGRFPAFCRKVYVQHIYLRRKYVELIIYHATVRTCFCVYVVYKSRTVKYGQPHHSFFIGSGGFWTTIRIKSSSGATRTSCFLLLILRYVSSLAGSKSRTMDFALSESCDTSTEYCKTKYKIAHHEKMNL